MPELPKIRNPQTHIEQRIHKALAEGREDRQWEPRLYLSRIGECVRLLWAELYGKAPQPDFPGRMLVLFELGNAIEEHVIGLLRKAGYPIAGEQDRCLMILDDKQGVPGRIDGRIQLKPFPNGEEAILEVKSANLAKFEEFEAVGYERWNPKYYDQLQSYMGATGIHLGLAVVYGKNDSRILAEKIRFDSERYEVLKQRAAAALGADMPERPEEATSQYCQYCKYCDAGEWCWGSTAGVEFDD